MSVLINTTFKYRGGHGIVSVTYCKSNNPTVRQPLLLTPEPLQSSLCKRLFEIYSPVGVCHNFHQNIFKQQFGMSPVALHSVMCCALYVVFAIPVPHKL